MSTIVAILKEEEEIQKPFPLILCLSNLLQNSEKYEKEIMEKTDKISIETLTENEYKSLVIHNDYAFAMKNWNLENPLMKHYPKNIKRLI